MKHGLAALAVLLAFSSTACVSMMRKRVALEPGAAETTSEIVDKEVQISAKVAGDVLEIETSEAQTRELQEKQERKYEWRRVGYYDHWLMYIDGNLSFALDIPICLGWGLYALFSSEYEIAYGPIGLLGAMLIPGITCNAEESGSYGYEAGQDSDDVDYTEEETEVTRTWTETVSAAAPAKVRVSGAGHLEQAETIVAWSQSEGIDLGEESQYYVDAPQEGPQSAIARVPLLPFVLNALRRGQTRLEIVAEMEP